MKTYDELTAELMRRFKGCTFSERKRNVKQAQKQAEQIKDENTKP